MSDKPPRDQPSESGADRDPVEAALVAAAAAPVTIGDERLSALEARVMGAVGGRDDVGAVAALGSGTVTMLRRRNRVVSLLSAAAVALVVALGALTVVLLADDDDALAIAAADRVVVELPDGEAVAGEAGTELPDGARLEVIGFVEIDGQRFGPGSYRIVDGEVVRSGLEPDEPAATSDRSSGFGDDGSDSSGRPATVDDDGADDGADDGGSARTTVPGGAQSNDESDETAPDDGRDGTDRDSERRPGGDVVPSPTDPTRTTAPQPPPDVTRPPASTSTPVRRTTVPARPATTTPSRLPTTTTPTTTTTTTTSATTSTSTTEPTRTTVVDGDGETRAGRP